MKLSPEVQQEALSHATHDSPFECCGLVLVHKGKQIYHACNNIAETPDEHFILDPLDYAEAEDKGEIVAILHSHPVSRPEPSEADRVACEKTGLPWHIVNPNTREWGYCEPCGYELPYVGRKFVHGVVDCYALVRDWYAKEWGLHLRDYDRRDQWWEKGENLYLDNFAKEGFREISVSDVERGDLILMNLVSPVPNHAAIYLGDQLVLHHVQGRLSSRDVFGGYYLKSSACGLRHESRHEGN